MKRLIVGVSVLAVMTHVSAGAASTIYRCAVPGKTGAIEFTDQFRGKHCKAMDNREPDLGMKMDQVKLMLGEPKRVTFVKTRSGKTEQWVFDDGLTLSFKNGSLEVIEQK